MIPLVDLAKHYNGCTNRLAVHRCGPIDGNPSASDDATVTTSDELCIYWTAGSNIAAGEDVCHAHGYLLPDRALLQYGFVLSQQQAAGKAGGSATQQQLQPELSAVDRHDLPAAVMPWQYRLEAKGPPPAFAGAYECLFVCGMAACSGSGLAGFRYAVVCGSSWLACGSAVLAGGCSESAEWHACQTQQDCAVIWVTCRSVCRCRTRLPWHAAAFCFVGCIAGTPEQTAVELERLTKLAATLAGGAAAAAAMKPAPGDEGGLQLSMLKHWRQQRQQAVAAALASLKATAAVV
jgi:hypothetical protein